MSREEGSLNRQNSNSGRRVSVADVANNNSSSNGRNSSEEQLAAVSNVTRVMRSVLPPDVRIAEDAKQVVLDGVSEFISVIAAEAIGHRSGNEGRANTTLRSQDVLNAMERLGFDDYVDPRTLFLHRYRRAQAAREGEPTSTASASGQAAGGGSGGGGGGGGPEGLPSLEPHPQRERNNGDDDHNGSSV